MNDFLPRDPIQALIEVKERLYDRLSILRSCITDETDSLDAQMLNEIEFLQEILDLIERS